MMKTTAVVEMSTISN